MKGQVHLGQTTATLLSVGKEEKDNPDRMLYEDLENWLCNNQEGGIYQEKDLIKAIVKNDRNKYIKAQVEALKLLEWLKKFATAYLSKEGDKT
jgi:CRISPR-associated protein Cmr5